MKRNKNQIKVIFLFIILLVSSILIYTSISYANSITTDEFATLHINPQYLEWEKLSDEEKTKTIMPAPYSITLKESIRRSTYNSLISLGTNSDISRISRYSLKESLKDIIVKNQLQTNDCWAFSTTSMIETTIAKKYNKVSNEYSPMHLEYYVNKTFNKGIGAGGNGYLALAYLASGKGPAYESDLPFKSIYNEISNPSSNYYLSPKENISLTQPVRAQLEEATFFASIYKDYDTSTKAPIYMDSYSNEYSETQVDILRDLVKEHIFNYGGVTAVYHSPLSLKEYTSFYNEEYSAWYCNNPSLEFNHQITIVGWDDHFGWDDEENEPQFNLTNQPKNMGAWIVLNSWGDTFGEDGYMYISYDDCHIENMIMGINDIYEIEEEGSLEYDNLYEYDPLGISQSLKWSSYSSAYLANVFTRDNTISKDEYLTRVGIFLDNTEGIEVYVNTKDDNLKSLTKVATFTGPEALTAGYHTIDITPIQLTGEKFVVAVKYIHSDGVTLPFECNLKESGLVTYSNYFDTATANARESYRSWDGKSWEDLHNLQVNTNWVLKNTNACIKAFTIEQEAVTTPVTDIKLDKTQETLEIGETLALTATVIPDNATNKNVIWSSSDSNVATVSQSGVVTAIAEGTTTISAVSEDNGKTATCIVTVQPPVVNVTGVSLNKTSAEIEVDSTVQLIATITPSNATNRRVSWSTSDSSIATVSESGVVTGILPGTALITVTSIDGSKTATATITVKDITPAIISVTGVSLNKTQKTLKINETLSLIPTITPDNATNKKVTWSSSDTNIAIVNGGIVTAVSKGSTTITVTTEDGSKTSSCIVTVEEPVVRVTEVSLNKTVGTIKQGATLQLVATVTPATATNKDVTWSSSNPEVATVKGGVVTGVSVGTSTITVTTEDGAKTAVCTVTVEEEPKIIPVTSVSLTVDKVSLEVGNKYTFVAQINPQNATNKDLTWLSSDEEIVEVSSTGLIKAKKEGTATITVITDDGLYTASAEVTVTKKVNTDDDIYTDPDEDEENTVSGVLPETGESFTTIAIIGIILIAGIVFIIKFKKYNLK